jgi:hypothetical protein
MTKTIDLATLKDRYEIWIAFPGSSNPQVIESVKLALQMANNLTEQLQHVFPMGPIVIKRHNGKWYIEGIHDGYTTHIEFDKYVDWMLSVYLNHVEGSFAN